MIAPAKEGEVSNYHAIDTMIDFGTKKITNMEQAWLTAVHDAEVTKPGNLDLKSTMEMIRSDVTFKKSKL